MRLCIVQPYLTKYREPVFEALTRWYEVTVLSSPADPGMAYGETDNNKTFAHHIVAMRTLLGGRLAYQYGVVRHIVRDKPDLVLIAANPRHLSYWLTLATCALLGLRCYSHGQGLYAKRSPSVLQKLMFRVMLALSTRYICYAPLVRDSLLKVGLPAEALRVAENSLSITCPVEPGDKTGLENGILFVGRLRKGSKVDILVNVVEELCCQGLNLELHIIGDGEESAVIREAASRLPWLHWYGMIYDQKRISDISRMCFIGCYPGDAGLSILHYMALSLPPVVHNDFAAHMGPEPSYVTDGKNGFLFSVRDTSTELHRVLESLARDRDKVRAAQVRTFQRYRSLIEPDLAHRMRNIFHEDEQTPRGS